MSKSADAESKTVQDQVSDQNTSSDEQQTATQTQVAVTYNLPDGVDPDSLSKEEALKLASNIYGKFKQTSAEAKQYREEKRAADEAKQAKEEAELSAKELAQKYKAELETERAERAKEKLHAQFVKKATELGLTPKLAEAAASMEADLSADSLDVKAKAAYDYWKDHLPTSTPSVRPGDKQPGLATVKEGTSPANRAVKQIIKNTLDKG